MKSGRESRGEGSLDTGGAHRLLPQLEVLLDRGREFSRRAADRVDADPVEPADEAGVLAPERDLARQTLDDLLRCAGGRPHPPPRLPAEAARTPLGDPRPPREPRR